MYEYNNRYTNSVPLKRKALESFPVNININCKKEKKACWVLFKEGDRQMHKSFRKMCSDVLVPLFQIIERHVGSMVAAKRSSKQVKKAAVGKTTEKGDGEMLPILYNMIRQKTLQQHF